MVRYQFFHFSPIPLNCRTIRDVGRGRRQNLATPAAIELHILNVHICFRQNTSTVFFQVLIPFKMEHTSGDPALKGGRQEVLSFKQIAFVRLILIIRSFLWFSSNIFYPSICTG